MSAGCVELRQGVKARGGRIGDEHRYVPVGGAAELRNRGAFRFYVRASSDAAYKPAATLRPPGKRAQHRRGTTRNILQLVEPVWWSGRCSPKWDRKARIGNPPFVDGKLLIEDYARMFAKHAARVPAEADRVRYWFVTNSIRGGTNRRAPSAAMSTRRMIPASAQAERFRGGGEAGLHAADVLAAAERADRHLARDGAGAGAHRVEQRGVLGAAAGAVRPGAGTPPAATRARPDGRAIQPNEPHPRRAR